MKKTLITAAAFAVPLAVLGVRAWQEHREKERDALCRAIEETPANVRQPADRIYWGENCKAEQARLAAAYEQLGRVLEEAQRRAKRHRGPVFAGPASAEFECTEAWDPEARECLSYDASDRRKVARAR